MNPTGLIVVWYTPNELPFHAHGIALPFRVTFFAVFHQYFFVVLDAMHDIAPNDLHHQRPTQAYRVSAAALLAVW